MATGRELHTTVLDGLNSLTSLVWEYDPARGLLTSPLAGGREVAVSVTETRILFALGPAGSAGWDHAWEYPTVDAVVAGAAGWNGFLPGGGWTSTTYAAPFGQWRDNPQTP